MLVKNRCSTYLVVNTLIYEYRNTDVKVQSRWEKLSCEVKVTPVSWTFSSLVVGTMQIDF